MEMQGVIVFYLPDKAYGYVRVPETREEFRFRKANLLADVQAGDRVQFVLRQGKQGYFADEIKLLSIT